MAGHRVASPPESILAEPLSLLYEEPGLPHQDLPTPLAVAYGGELGFSETCLYGNFVASIDGVVALGPGYPSSGSAISGHEPADRFVMGLLRAFADAVLIGAGTLRATPTHRWTPEHVCPAAAADFADLRDSLRRAAEPELVVVTASGDLPTEHPALRHGALVATTTAGLHRISGHAPKTCTLLAVGDGPQLRMADVLTAIRSRGHTNVLTEGGPQLLGQLVGDRLLDELFLTMSPVLAGRAERARPGLVTGIELLPQRSEWSDLVSLRQQASYLFLRYRLQRSQPEE
jgi:riboflavin biosynthesis pyrimidine reductase